MAHLYLPTHATVLKLIHQVVCAGHACKIPVSVCGEMAASPELLPLLIGLGVDDILADCRALLAKRSPEILELIS